MSFACPARRRRLQGGGRQPGARHAPFSDRHPHPQFEHCWGSWEWRTAWRWWQPWRRPPPPGSAQWQGGFSAATWTPSTTTGHTATAAATWSSWAAPFSESRTISCPAWWKSTTGYDIYYLRVLLDFLWGNLVCTLIVEHIEHKYYCHISNLIIHIVYGATNSTSLNKERGKHSLESKERTKMSPFIIHRFNDKLRNIAK